jgi:hypothetical protein
MSEGFLRSTIHIMTEVTADSEYLMNYEKCTIHPYTRKTAYHVKIYCVWLFRKLTSGARPIGMPFASLSYDTNKFGTAEC